MFKNEEKVIKEINEDPEKMTFIFNESKEYLNNIIQSVRVLRTKSTALLGFLLTSIAFSFSKFVENTNKINKNSFEADYYNYFLVYIIFTYCVISAYLSFKTFTTRKFRVPGIEPRGIIESGYINYSLSMIKLDQCKKNQEKIDTNLKLLWNISKSFNRSFYAAVFFSLIGIVGLLILLNFDITSLKK